MATGENAVSAGRSGDSSFAATHWSVVLAARGDAEEARSALGQLCAIYWYPLYAFVRRQGYSGHDAQDLTQGFFNRLLEKGWLDHLDHRRGKFRSFLLASMTHFLSNQRDHARALKRGGGQMMASLDGDAAESRYALEPVDNATPERIFERRWAITLLEQVLDRLGAEFAAAGKQELFNALKASLTGQTTPYAEIGQLLGMSEGAVKVAAHRLKQRYRELIRSEVAQTVGSDDAVDEELRELMAAVRL